MLPLTYYILYQCKTIIFGHPPSGGNQLSLILMLSLCILGFVVNIILYAQDKDAAVGNGGIPQFTFSLFEILLIAPLIFCVSYAHLLVPEWKRLARAISGVVIALNVNYWLRFRLNPCDRTDVSTFYALALNMSNTIRVVLALKICMFSAYKWNHPDCNILDTHSTRFEDCHLQSRFKRVRHAPKELDARHSRDS